MSKQRSTLLPKTAPTSNEFIVKLRPFDKLECCFDTVVGVDGALELWTPVSSFGIQCSLITELSGYNDGPHRRGSL